MNVDTPDHWQELASCRGLDVNHFFEGIGRRNGRPTSGEDPVAEYAKSICRTCPVVDPCRELGMEQSYGVYGGLTPAERDAHRLRRCTKGHLLTPDNTYIEPDGRAPRCVTCRKATAAKLVAAKAPCPVCGKYISVRNTSNHVRRMHGQRVTT